MPDPNLAVIAKPLISVARAIWPAARRLRTMRQAGRHPFDHADDLLDTSLDDGLALLRQKRGVNIAWWRDLLHMIGHAYVAPDLLHKPALQDWLAKKAVQTDIKALARARIMGATSDDQLTHIRLAEAYASATGEATHLARGPIEIVTAILVASHLLKLSADDHALLALIQAAAADGAAGIQHLEQVLEAQFKNLPSLLDAHNNQGQTDHEILKKIITSDDYKIRAVNKLFDFLETQLRAKPGAEHVRYVGDHPDDAYAHRTIAGFLRQGGVELRAYTGQPSAAVDGTILCFGSPVSNALTRLILDYKEKEPGDPARGLIRKSHPKFVLPFEFIADPNQLATMGADRRLDPLWPNWSIYDTLNHLQFVPQIRNDRRGYANDYLMITVIPNLLDLKSYQQGNKITLFTGTHGVGTRAVRILFESAKLLSALLAETKNHEAWQAVIKIDAISPISEKERQHPLSVSDTLWWAPVIPNAVEIDAWFQSTR